MEYTRETGVPVPNPTAGRGNLASSGLVYALRTMQLGESIFVPGRNALWMSRKIHDARKQHPSARYTTRTYPDGVRVWFLGDGVTAEQLFE